jgi:hypothetical protein
MFYDDDDKMPKCRTLILYVVNHEMSKIGISNRLI